MKKSFLALSTSVFLLIAAGAQAQSAGGGSAGGAGGTSGGGATSSAPATGAATPGSPSTANGPAPTITPGTPTPGINNTGINGSSTLNQSSSNATPGTVAPALNGNPGVPTNMNVPGTNPANPSLGNNSVPGSVPLNIPPPATMPSAGGGSSTVIPSNMNTEQFATFAASRWAPDNGTGPITSSRWNTINSTWFGGKGPDFNSIDTNHDGVLEPSEVQALFANNPSLFQRFDTNHDGVIDATEAARIPAQ